MDTSEIIDTWSDILSQRIIEVRFVDIDTMKASIKTYVISALMDCLRIQTSQTEKDLFNAKMVLLNEGGGKRNRNQQDIIFLNKKKKEQNKFRNQLEDIAALIEAKRFLREKYPSVYEEIVVICENVENKCRVQS